MSKDQLKDQIIIYCDGACSGNPGPGGWASSVIFANRNHVQEIAGSAAATTNNRMEITGSLAALTLCANSKDLATTKKIIILTDSVYVIRGITQWIFGWKKRGWKTAANEPVSNQDLWEQLEVVVKKIKAINTKVELQWSFVKGHAGIAGNERCDQIAVAFTKHDYIELYNGPASSYHFDAFELPELKPLPEIKKKDDGPKKPAWYISYINGVIAKHNTWSECEAKVKGRPAKFKKVTSNEEEAEVKKSWGIT
ncbi:MAG: ribonuclease HI [Bdellovibrionaceae bacterium]|nr:ribonuclease HI [Bdellovibrio sp.]